MLKFSKLLMVSALAFMLVIAGCSESESPTQPATQSPEMPDGATMQSVEVRYDGSETLDEMLANYQALQDSGVISQLTSAEEQRMIEAFLERNRAHATIAAAGQTILAYTAYYYWSGTDTDLKLEYKWWAGSPQRYYMSTPNWALYWAIQVCYGGRVTNWYWMEGGHQRVSAVVGDCLYRPFSAGYVRYYLRVTTY